MRTVIRTIGRTLILLAAALVVVGVLLAISKISPQAQAADPRGEFSRPGFEPGSGQTGDTAGRQNEFRHRFEGEGHHGPGGGPGEGRGGFIVFSLLKNLVVIAVIVLLYQAVNRLGGRLARRKAVA